MADEREQNLKTTLWLNITPYLEDIICLKKAIALLYSTTSLSYLLLSTLSYKHKNPFGIGLFLINRTGLNGGMVFIFLRYSVGL